MTLNGSALNHWIRWSLAALVVLILLIGLTGALLLMRDLVEGNGPTTLSSVPVDTRPDVNLDNVVAIAQREVPGRVVHYVLQHPRRPGIWSVGLGESISSPASNNKWVDVDSKSEQVVGEPAEASRFFVVLRQLHADMFIGPHSQRILPLLVLLVVTPIVLIIFRRRSMKEGSFAAKPISRLRHAVVLGWLGVMALTGIVHTFGPIILDQWQSSVVADVLAQNHGRRAVTRPVSVDRVADAARRSVPGREIEFINYPGGSVATPFHFSVYTVGRSGLGGKIYQPVLIDAETAQVLPSYEVPPYVAAMMLMMPIHAGNNLGPIANIVWHLLAWLSVAQLLIWLKRLVVRTPSTQAH